MAGIDDRSIYEADRLDEFLSDVVQSQSAARAGAGLDPALAEAVRATVSLAVAPPPSADFARHLRAELMRQADAIAPVSAPAARPATRRLRLPHPAWFPTLPSHGERRNWVLAQFATALLLIVTAVAIWISFRSDQKAGPIGGTATPVNATPVSGDGPSAAVYRGGAARTGVSPGPGLTNPPVERWTAAPNMTHTDPVVADGVVYTITGNGDLVAWDALTGQQLWRRDTDIVGDAITPPLVATGVLFAGLPDGIFYALNAGDGAVLWQYPAGGPSCGSPALVDGTVYGAEGCDTANAPGGAVFALDAATGRELWRVTIDDVRITTPAVAEGTVVLGAGGPIATHGYPSTIRAFDAATGQERWHVEVGGIESAPAFVDGTVYVASDHGLWALAAADGSVRWHAQVGRDDLAVAAPPAVAVGLVFVVTNDGYLFAFDTATGEPRWEFDPGGFYNLSTAAPTVVDGVVYLGTKGGDLFAINAATGTQQWRLRLGSSRRIDTAPTIVDGVLYLSARGLIALAEPAATPAT